MDIRTTHRLDHSAAEQLFCGPAGVSNVYPLLSGLLVSAAAPGRPDEWTSEYASLAAFRAAWLTPAPGSRRLTMLKTTVLKLLTVKVVAAAAVATVATGGVALAASTGTLPNPLDGKGMSAASTHASDPAVRHSPGTDASEGADGKGSKDGKGTAGSPSPSLIGLCHAYNAGNKTEHGKALDNPAFTALITTAGGRAKVDGFCQAVLASAKPSAATSHGSASPDNDSHATGAPTVHPTGAPTGHPTGAPTGHPTGKPSAAPTH